MYEDNSWYDKLPNETLEVCEENYNLFFEVMRERMLIWQRRFLEKRPAPWTENTILRDYKFTNVYRELDRNSQWQIHNILRDDTLDEINLVWKLMIFRIFNNPETFERGKRQCGWRNGIPDWRTYNKEEFEQFIQTIRDDKQNPFTNAYLINSASGAGHTRHWFYTNVVVPTIHKKIPLVVGLIHTTKKPEDLIKQLTKIPAVADFIAHEFYQDFTYIERYTDRKPFKFNQNDFTNVGPGARLGLRLIFPNSNSSKDGIYKLRDAAEKELAKFGGGKIYIQWNKQKQAYENTAKCNITLHQIEMWLCEFQKYWKMQIGEGKQRSKFVAKTMVK